MKIYRCVIGSLLVLFIAIGIWYVASYYDEHRSIEDGVLIWYQEQDWNRSMRGDAERVTDHDLCEGIRELYCLR